jgi:ribosome-associated translation inhibitor RaiA
MGQTDFYVDFHNAINEDENLQIEAERRLLKLAEGHTDMVGAAVHMTEPAEGRASGYANEATVVVYGRPNQLAATEISDSPMGALKGALDAVERQVREQRARLREQQRS